MQNTCSCEDTWLVLRPNLGSQVDEFSAGRGKVLVALAFAAWIWLEVEKERPLFEVRVSFIDKALQRT